MDALWPLSVGAARTVYAVLAGLVVLVWVLELRRQTRSGRIGGPRALAYLVPLGAVLAWLGAHSGLSAIVGAGLAFCLIGLMPLAYRPPRRRGRALPGWVRLRGALTPDPPELELTLLARGARVHNVSGGLLRLYGWSPGEAANGWLPLRDEDGHPLQWLPPKSAAELAGWAGEGEVRVWYARSDEGQGNDAQVRLFRAGVRPRGHLN